MYGLQLLRPCFFIENDHATQAYFLRITPEQIYTLVLSKEAQQGKDVYALQIDLYFKKNPLRFKYSFLPLKVCVDWRDTVGNEMIFRFIR